MILQAANSGGVAPFERNDDAQAFLFDPFLQVAQLDLKLAQLGFISFALHVAPALVVFLGIFARQFGHQYGSRLSRRRRKAIQTIERQALVDLSQNLSGYDFLKESSKTFYKAR
jgi:hypothetical protein